MSELFPISSLGHSALLPGLLSWHIDQNAESFLEFLVATHLATAVVLFIFYFKDWVRIVKGMFRSPAAREVSDADPDAKLGWLLVVSTIPAGFVGLLLKNEIRGLLSFIHIGGVLPFIERHPASRGREDPRAPPGRPHYAAPYIFARCASNFSISPSSSIFLNRGNVFPCFVTYSTNMRSGRISNNFPSS